jgi:hypothetical protein
LSLVLVLEHAPRRLDRLRCGIGQLLRNRLSNDWRTVSPTKINDQRLIAIACNHLRGPSMRTIQQRDSGLCSNGFVSGAWLARHDACQLGEALDGRAGVLTRERADVKASLGSAAKIAAAARPI